MYRVPTAAEDEQIEAATRDEAKQPEVVEKLMNGIFLLAIHDEERSKGRDFYRTVRGRVVRQEDVTDKELPPMHGERLGGRWRLPLAFVYGEDRPIYRYRRGRLVEAGIAEKHARFVVRGETRIKGRRLVKGPKQTLIARDGVRVVRRVRRPANIPAGAKWIHVDLSSQALVAYEGRRPVLATVVSGGKQGFEAPHRAVPHPQEVHLHHHGRPGPRRGLVRGGGGALDDVLPRELRAARRLLAQRLRQAPQPRVHQHRARRRALAVLLVRSTAPRRVARLRAEWDMDLLHAMITSHDDSRLLPLRPAPALAPRGELDRGRGAPRAPEPAAGDGPLSRGAAARAAAAPAGGDLRRRGAVHQGASQPRGALRRAGDAAAGRAAAAGHRRPGAGGAGGGQRTPWINDLDPFQVRALARRWIDTLARLGDSVLPRLRVLRASQLHATPRYRDVLEEVRRRAPGGAHPYVLREVADIEHLRRELGGVLKVGWAICSCGDRGHDERFFDARHRAWVGSAVGFVYCKAGRALDDRRPRAAPYITTDPERRICLSPGEDVEAKLARASALGHASASTVRGVRKQLKMIARAYRELGHPLRGPVEQRTQTIIDEMLVPANGARRRARGRR